MTIEIRMLVFAALLGVVQLLVAAHGATLVRGLKWNLSSREAKLPELVGWQGRVDRAFKNFMETFPFFIAAVVAVQFTNRNNDMSALGAQVYLYARLLYVPLYAFGIVGLRTVVWVASFVGLFLVFWPLFL